MNETLNETLGQGLPVVDVPLLRKAYEWALAESKKPATDTLWDQGAWRTVSSCGTAFCIAGYVAQITGAEWRSPECVNATDEDIDTFIHPGETRPVVSVLSRAQRLLGLTDEEVEALFYCDTDIRKIRTVMERIAQRAGDTL